MTVDPQEFVRVVSELRALPAELTWVEFKENNADPVEIGEYISALSNAAALESKPRGYLLWGVDDSSHALTGTKFNPNASKFGGEDLIPWITQALTPQVHFEFHRGVIDDKVVVLLEISAADHRPVQFKGTEFIRIGSYKKKLKDYADHARRLWRTFDSRSFETLTALDHLSGGQVLELLDYESFFNLSNTPKPGSDDEILAALTASEMVRRDLAAEWSITNLGALLFAHDLNSFSGLSRKTTRVIQYAGESRVRTIREDVMRLGYAVSFQILFAHVTSLLPTNEIIEKALRTTTPLYPDLALRELIANMLVHQDLTISGTGPVIEIFDGRIEITNPGVPLIDKARFVDLPPISRNEKLARAMRIIGICEERGSGWDKIGFEVEFHQLPAPLIETTDSHTKVVLFAPRPLTKMQRDDRVRAVYLHACLRTVIHQQATNSSIRERFGLSPGSAATASRLIKEALEAGALIPYDSAAGKRAMSYVPFWAETARSLPS